MLTRRQPGRHRAGRAAVRSRGAWTDPQPAAVPAALTEATTVLPLVGRDDPQSRLRLALRWRGAAR